MCIRDSFHTDCQGGLPNDHSGGQKKLTEVTRPVIENERSYRGLNSFDARDFEVLAAVSRGEYMTCKEVITAGLAVRNLVLVPALS